MHFKKFNQQIQKQFASMCKTGKLFRSNVTGNVLWDLYLASFEKEEIFRDPESSAHNCNCCKNFVRRYGNIVAINDNGKLESMFSNIGNVGEYTQPSKKLAKAITSAKIDTIFFETYDNLNNLLNYESCKKSQSTYKLGVASNLKKYTQEEAAKFGVVNTEEVYKFEHFCIALPNHFVDFAGDSIEKIAAKYNDKYSVFQRAMKEIPLDTLSLVKDLINQESLLDGTAHLHAINAAIICKEEYEGLKKYSKNNWMWETSYALDERIAKFKNTLIGVLCTELAEGEELNKACLNWNKRVDPANYHKAKAPITQKQIEKAKEFVEENGYTESFNRRLATIDDIKVSEIKHINSGDGKIKEASIFDNVKSTATRHKRNEFKGIEKVSIEKFMNDILPTCSSVEVLLDSKHEQNMSVLTTSKIAESKNIFKWDNNYSWTFNGNLAGKSHIKDAVKEQGGKIDGVLRFSINWAEGEWSDDNSDLDAWARQPNNTKIGFSTYKGHETNATGILDVDIINPKSRANKNIVENITWSDLSKMPDGVYKFWVNQYSANNSKGFKAEIEFNGEVFEYEYKSPVKNNVVVAEVTKKGDKFSIKHILHEANSSKEIWGVETQQFHKVNLVCLSPNHWGNNNVGNTHYFFMLKGCKSPDAIRSFHNENLLPKLLEHKKVMEVLGSTNMIEPTGTQLAGVGFNATVRDSLIVKLSGNFKRVIKIKF